MKIVCRGILGKRPAYGEVCCRAVGWWDLGLGIARHPSMGSAFPISGAVRLRVGAPLRLGTIIVLELGRKIVG